VTLHASMRDVINPRRAADCSDVSTDTPTPTRQTRPQPAVPAFLSHNVCRKFIVNNTINLFFFKLQSTFWQFQTITVSECCLIKLLPYILFEKYTYISALEMATGQPREPALWQLYRHTFVPYSLWVETNAN